MSFGASDQQSYIDRVSRDNTIVNKTATATLTPAETYVVVTPAAATTITLPPVGACKDGSKVAIYIVDATTYNVTIADNANDNKAGFTDIVCNENKVLMVFENVAQQDWVLGAVKNDGAHLPVIADIT